MSRLPQIPFAFREKTPNQMAQAAEHFAAWMALRRSIREFSSRHVPRHLIELAIRTAVSAPSGANLQPWRFVAISDARIKSQIRQAAEREEYISYEQGRMPDLWRAAVEPLGTDWRKPFLEQAPWLVVVFEEKFRPSDPTDDSPSTAAKNYYVKESVGIACGLFIAAVHNMGLVTLTHTPSPMNFLSTILDRPPNERPYLIFPVGYPATSATVPALTKKEFSEVTEFHVDEPVTAEGKTQQT